MLEPVRHRQTKGAATDMFVLPPPRHTPTLPVETPVFMPIGIAGSVKAMTAEGVANRSHLDAKPAIFLRPRRR
jgi:hypothetical protein